MKLFISRIIALTLSLCFNIGFTSDIEKERSFKQISTNYLIQDQTVDLPKTVGHFREIILSDQWFRKGPSCQGIKVLDNPIAAPNRRGNFQQYRYDSRQFDAVHTFTVVFNTYAFWQQRLGELAKFGSTEKVSKLAQNHLEGWITLDKSRSLRIYPHSNSSKVRNNAHYIPSEHKLEFGLAKGPSNTNLWLCQSMDIVAHETGHAILHTLQPGFDDSSRPFDEAFGDLTATLVMLEDSKIQTDIIKRFNRKLHDVDYMVNLAEGFSYKAWKKPGIRNLNRDCTTDTCGMEEHDQSQAFSGAVYNALAYVIENEAQDFDTTLQQLSLNLLSGILQSNHGNSPEIAQYMLQTELSIWQRPLKAAFQYRGLIAVYIPKALPLKLDVSALQQVSSRTLTKVEDPSCLCS